jgi:hypothetical protein
MCFNASPLRTRRIAISQSARRSIRMKKEEFEPIFSDGENAPDTGPIETYLHAVATEQKLPRFAIGMCTVRIE